MELVLPTLSLLLLLAAALTVTAASVPKFPARFTADVQSVSSWGKLGCYLGMMPLITKVFQDEKSSYWSHHSVIKDEDEHIYYQEVLFTVPASTADPDTPEATKVTRFAWNSDTEWENCKYEIYNPKHVSSLIDVYPMPGFFNFIFNVSKFEKQEAVGKVECEKWTGECGDLSCDWAVWFPINAQPRYSVVAKAQYVVKGIVISGCTMTYNFANFSTDPIPQEVFAPPKQWLTKCNNSDGGIKAENIPEHDKYICVSPGKTNHISIALLSKPHINVIVQIKPCTVYDNCVNGARCKDCVKFSKTTLTFGPSNWSVFQTVDVAYLADGDSQFKITSPDYYVSIENYYNLLFSTCACATGGNCSCQKSCS